MISIFGLAWKRSQRTEEKYFDLILLNHIWVQMVLGERLTIKKSYVYVSRDTQVHFYFFLTYFNISIPLLFIIFILFSFFVFSPFLTFSLFPFASSIIWTSLSLNFKLRLLYLLFPFPQLLLFSHYFSLAINFFSLSARACV